MFLVVDEFALAFPEALLKQTVQLRRRAPWRPVQTWARALLSSGSGILLRATRANKASVECALGEGLPTAE